MAASVTTAGNAAASRFGLKRFQLALAEWPPMSSRQVAQAQMTDANPNEFFDLVSQLVKHATDLPVDSLTQDHAHARRPDRLHLFHPSVFSVERHPGQQFRHERRIPRTIECHFVFLFNFGARMRQAVRKIAIVRQDEKSFGLRIESANIEKARELRRQKIENRVARIGIGARRDEAGRFMQDEVELALAVHELTSDFDMITFGRLRAEVGADATVDCNAPIGNQLVAMPPRTDAGRSEETV